MHRDKFHCFRILGVGLLALGALNWGVPGVSAQDDPRTVQRYIRTTSWGSAAVRLRPQKQPLRTQQTRHGKTGRRAQQLMKDMRWIKLVPLEEVRKNQPVVKIRPHIPKTTLRQKQLGNQVQRITAPQIRRLSSYQVTSGRSAKSLSRSKGYSVTPEMAATGRNVTSVVQQIIRRPPPPKADPLASLKLQKDKLRVTTNPMAGTATP